MNPNYLSDLDADDPPEMPWLKADGGALMKIALTTLALLALELAAIWALRPAQAAEQYPVDLKCVPSVSDYDHAYMIEGAVAALVWWCDQPDGLYTGWVAGTVPGGITPKTQADALLEIGGKDPGELLRKIIVREATPSEMELVARIEIAHSPRCYVTGTAATAAVLTASAQGTLGEPKLDSAGVGVRVAVGAPVGCQDRLAKETAKRYCGASTLTDSKGRLVAAETWVACKIERAPREGWL